jgi:hypothetical protein
MRPVILGAVQSCETDFQSSDLRFRCLGILNERQIPITLITCRQTQFLLGYWCKRPLENFA